MRTFLCWTASCLLAIACGGESAEPQATGGAGVVGSAAGSGGTGAQPNTGGAPAKSVVPWPSPKPSFTLTTTQKKSQTLTGPAFAATRLDLKDGTAEAGLGAKVACKVEVSASAITLAECGKDGPVTVEDLVLPRAEDGGLTGTFAAVSRYQGLFQGDMLMNEVTEFSGTVALDTEPPELQVIGGAVRPWNGMKVTASEGVDQAQLIQAVTVTPLSGSAPPIQWTATAATPAWSGAVAMTGAFGDWAALADGPSFELSLLAVPDLNGNPSGSAKATVQALAVGKPLGAHDFEAGTLTLFGSGNAAVSTSATTCESGACVTLGPGDGCTGGGGELVGLLDVSGKSKLRLRARVVASGTTPLPKFQLRLYSPSGEKSSAAVGHFDAAAATSPVLGLTYGASFGDDVVPLPASGSVIGFELGLPGDFDYFCSPGATVALVVEKISAEL